MTCRCREIEQLHGAEGQTYEKDHLRRLSIDEENWQVLLECPETGLLWKKYYPQAEAHGGGPPEYVRISLEIAQKEFDFSRGPSTSDR